MTFESTDIHIGFERKLSTKEIREITDFCFEMGCTTGTDKEPDECWYLGEATEYLGDFIEISTAIDDMANNQFGFMSPVGYKDVEFLLGTRSTSEVTATASELYISVEPVNFRPSDTEPTLVHDLIEFVKRLAEFTQPKLVLGGESSTFGEGKDTPLAVFR